MISKKVGISLELMDLKVIKTIVEEGSISRAASKLDYVQSNITARVQKLESELGVPLFNRHPKGVTPTDKGRLLSEYASEILRLTQEAVKEVKEPDYPSGELIVGIVETVAASNMFIRSLSHFQSQYPEVSISLVTGTSMQNHQRLLDRKLDGAFFTGDFDISKLEVEMTIEDTVVLVSSNQTHQLSKLKEAPNATWIVFPKGCPFRASIEKWIDKNNGEKANMIEVSTTETMLNCVRAGLGYALLPDSVERKGDDNLCLLSIPEEYRYATTRFVRRSEKFSNRALTAFSECMKEVQKG
ncbi:LysR family transcriptional regulator [Shimazuella kribbensis]|uniref:LysR family transcriptional regulator n=1 Tax=Shimazuella kribbensis TaxID=139808 RepID=UPI0003FC96AB|nr:LysR family transcriptional regulator [Shimazuella kribbensis]